jgi:hypothetical protein
MTGNSVGTRTGLWRSVAASTRGAVCTPDPRKFRHHLLKGLHEQRRNCQTSRSLKEKTAIMLLTATLRSFDILSGDRANLLKVFFISPREIR